MDKQIRLRDSEIVVEVIREGGTAQEVSFLHFFLLRRDLFLLSCVKKCKMRIEQMV